ncbi:MAG: 2Fe-2S iron-sulfur cluster-binding protein, partial [Actinomycetota bacterium]|nr:2Fe-2S iron-sulfur cluster-binding protein [Actinomycetota bacterium]
MRHEITMTVNGEVLDLGVVPADVLLDVLRDGLGVKSPKIGCERGDCGSCTVILDGRTVRSCL